MNKKTVAEQAHRILVGGSPTTESDIKKQEVELLAGEVIDSVFVEYIEYKANKEKRSTISVSRNYLKETSISIINKIGTLPSSLDLCDNKGIYGVTRKDGTEVITYYPINMSWGLSDGLESTNLEGSNGYIITGSEIELITSDDPSSINIYHIPSATDASRTDELKAPNRLMSAVIERLVKHFSPHVEIPHDDKQDNKDN